MRLWGDVAMLGGSLFNVKWSPNRMLLRGSPQQMILELKSVHLPRRLFR